MIIEEVLSKKKIFLVITVTIVALVFLYIGTKVEPKLKCEKCLNKNERQSNTETVCLSEECLGASMHYKSAMDTNTDPCDDFYEFSCKQWNAERDDKSVFKVTQDRISIVTEKFLKLEDNENDPSPVKQSRILYRSCLNANYENVPRIEVFRKHLNNLNLSLIPHFFEVSDVSVDWINLEIDMSKSFSTNAFLTIKPDRFNNSIVEINIRSRAHENFLFLFLQLSSRVNRSPIKPIDDTEDGSTEYYGSGSGNTYNYDSIYSGDGGLEDKEDQNTNDYENFFSLANVTDLRRILSKFGYIDTSNRILTAAASLNDMQSRIDTLYNNRYYTSVYRLKSLEESLDIILLSKNIKNSKHWIKFVNNLKHLIPDYEKDVYVKIDLKTIDSFLSYINNSSDRDIELYVWRAATEEIEKFYDRLIAFSVYRYSSKNCTVLVNQLMGMAVSYGVTNVYFNHNINKQVNVMVANIQELYIDAIHRNKWINIRTVSELLEKANNMSRVIGHSKLTKDQSLLEEHYKNINLTETDYYGNVFDLFVTIYSVDLTKFLIEFSRSPNNVNAHYDKNENSINIPMAILNRPMYHLGLDALNYGALGSIIGHEIVHGFDYEDIAKNGSLSEMYELNYRLKCFQLQYSNIANKTDFLTLLISILTRSENIADTAGINLSYLAYMKANKSNLELRLPGFPNYTHNQLFFIAFATIWCGENNDSGEIDSHATNRYRVTAAMQNSRYFADSFKCAKGTKMNPVRTRCDLFS